MIKCYLILLLAFLVSCSNDNAGTSTNTGTTIASSTDSTLKADQPLTIKIVNHSSDTNILFTNELKPHGLQKNESFKLKLHYEFRRAFDYQLKKNKLEATLIDSGTILNNNIFWNDDSLDYPCVLTLATNLGQKNLSKVFYSLQDLKNTPDLFSFKDSVQIEVDPIITPSTPSETWVGFLGSSSFINLNDTNMIIGSTFSDLSKLVIINDLSDSKYTVFIPDTSLHSGPISSLGEMDSSQASYNFSTSSNNLWTINFSILP
jgi:hypothetical protein